MRIAETPKYPNDEILKEINNRQRSIDSEIENRQKYDEIQVLRDKLKQSKFDLNEVASKWMQNFEGKNLRNAKAIELRLTCSIFIEGLPQDDVTCIVRITSILVIPPYCYTRPNAPMQLFIYCLRLSRRYMTLVMPSQQPILANQDSFEARQKLELKYRQTFRPSNVPSTIT